MELEEDAVYSQVSMVIDGSFPRGPGTANDKEIHGFIVYLVPKFHPIPPVLAEHL